MDTRKNVAAHPYFDLIEPGVCEVAIEKGAKRIFSGSTPDSVTEVKQEGDPAPPFSL